MISKLFDLSHRVAVITGGAGMLGRVHAAVIAEAGGIPVIVDINEEGARAVADDISKKYGVKSFGVKVDITQKSDIERFLGIVLKETGRIDILINNAANNPMVKKNSDGMTMRFEDFTLDPQTTFNKITDYMGIGRVVTKKLPLIMVTETPSDFRWHKRKEIIEKLTEEPKVKKLMKKLGYSMDPKTWI